MKKLVSAILLFLWLTVPVYGQNDGEETEIDHLALASLMIYDGRLDKAEEELAQVDTMSETFDGATYYTIRGVLASKQEEYKKAIEHYRMAIDATEAKTFEPPKLEQSKKYLFSLGKSEKKNEPASPEFDAEKVKKEKLEKLHIHLSQAYYRVKDYANTVKHLDLAGDRGRDRAALFILRADCYWKIQRFDDAIHALNRGLTLFPKDAALLKQKYYYFADLGLFQSAIACAKEYMAEIDADANEYIIFGQLLLEVGQDDEAIKILEKAKGKFPKNAKIAMLLGHIYMEKDMNFTAAHLFKGAAYHDKKYLKDAVEMHRRVKDFTHAVFLNAQMGDKVESLKQKVAIYLDRGEFEKVIGLTDGLERYNLLEDDNLRYALAYAYYMAKDYPNAELHLKQIYDNELFAKGSVILRNIEMCKENGTECF
jgi:tetratricopeptide (TPR) repeat protein